MNSVNPFMKKLAKYKVMYFFLLPAVLFCLVFNYAPMVGVIMSFEKYDVMKGMFASPFIGFENFAKFTREPEFYNALKNSIGLNVFSILIGFPMPIALAILIFSMRDNVFKRVTQTISYLPHFVSWVVIAGLIYKMLDKDTGVINICLKAFGVQPVSFMKEPKYFWWITIFTSIWKELGWNTIIYLAALSSIDVEQYEAAIVDGAKGYQKLFYITLPGLAPVISLILIFTIGSIINGSISFDAIYNMRNPFVASASDTLDYYIYQQGIMRVDYGYSTAMGLVLSLVSFSLVMISNNLSRRIRGYGAF